MVLNVGKLLTFCVFYCSVDLLIPVVVAVLDAESELGRLPIPLEKEEGEVVSLPDLRIRHKSMLTTKTKSFACYKFIDHITSYILRYSVFVFQNMNTFCEYFGLLFIWTVKFTWNWHWCKILSFVFCIILFYITFLLKPWWYSFHIFICQRKTKTATISFFKHSFTVSNLFFRSRSGCICSSSFFLFC